MQGFVLRKLHYNQDIGVLYDLISNPSEQVWFQTNQPINSMQEFQHWFDGNLRNEYHDFYIVEEQAQKKIVGFVYSYAYRVYDLHCKVAVVLCPEYRQCGIGAFMGLTFMNLLFSQYPIRKIYVDIYDFNKESLQSNLEAGFVEEGRLKEYRYFANQYHDLHVLSMERKVFEEKYTKKMQDLSNEE